MGCGGSKLPNVELPPTVKVFIAATTKTQFASADLLRAVLPSIHGVESSKSAHRGDREAIVIAALKSTTPLSSVPGVPKEHQSGKTGQTLSFEICTATVMATMRAHEQELLGMYDPKKFDVKTRRQGAQEVVLNEVRVALKEEAMAFIHGPKSEDHAAPAAPAQRPEDQPASEHRGTIPQSPARDAVPEATEELAYPLPEGNWMKAENPDFYWSDTDKLFYFPAAGHFFDPESQFWYVPNKDEWMTEEDHDRELQEMQARGDY